MNIRYQLCVAVGLFGLGSALGYYAGFQANKPIQVQETYKPAITQTDGSVILERKPDAKAKPKQTIPPGDTVERIVSVEVETAEPTTHVAVDLTIVSEPDGGKRVVASSPDGRIIGSTDIPVAPILIPRVQNWTVGGLYSPSTRRYGGFVQYKKGPYVAQVLAMSDNVYVGVGINF